MKIASKVDEVLPWIAVGLATGMLVESMGLKIFLELTIFSIGLWWWMGRL